MANGRASRSLSPVVGAPGPDPLRSVISDKLVEPLITGHQRSHHRDAARANTVMAGRAHPGRPRRRQPLRRLTSRLIASARVLSLSRKLPRTAEVTVLAPGLRTPRMAMHR